MHIRVKVNPSSRHEKIEELEDGSYRIHITAPPANNKANIAVIEIVGKHFGKPKSQVRIIAGFTSQIKLIRIDE